MKENLEVSQPRRWAYPDLDELDEDFDEDNMDGPDEDAEVREKVRQVTISEEQPDTGSEPYSAQEPDAKVEQHRRVVENAGQNFMQAVMGYFTARYEHDAIVKDRKADPQDIFPAAQAHREAEALMKQQMNRFYEVFISE